MAIQTKTRTKARRTTTKPRKSREETMSESAAPEMVAVDNKRPSIEELLQPVRDDITLTLLGDFLTNYVNHVVTIEQWKAKFERAATSKWNTSNLIAEGRKNSSEHPEIKAALDNLSELQRQLDEMRRTVASTIAKALGIEDYNPDPVLPSEEEKEQIRTQHVAVAHQLVSMIRSIPQTIRVSSEVTSVINKVLEHYPVPSIGRGGAASKGVPRYRVDIKASRDGATIFEVAGFAAAAMYARKIPVNVSAENFRQRYEEAGKNDFSFEVSGVRFDIKNRTK